MNTQIIEQIKDICIQHRDGKNFFITGVNLSENNQMTYAKLLKLPLGTQIVAFIKTGDVYSDEDEKVIAKSGLAICDTGIYWKNESSNPNQPLFDKIIYSDLMELTLTVHFLQTATFNNGKKFSIISMGMKKKIFIELFADLKVFAGNNIKQIAKPKAAILTDISALFSEMTTHVQNIIDAGILKDYTDFYTINPAQGASWDILEKNLFYFKNRVNETQINNFMQFYNGKATELLSDEFPIFGYAEKHWITPDKYWICTNKRLYRSGNVQFMGVDSHPVIELENITKFSMKEHAGKMVLHYGLLRSDAIALPPVSIGIFSNKFEDMFNDIVAIFDYLKSML